MLLAAALLAAAAAPAAAEPTIAEGGPSAAAAKKRLVGALAAVDLAVCFKAAPGRVRIALEVGADGKVKKSGHKDGGAAGQCAAGILAVQTLPADGAYRAVVQLDGASGGARTQESIDAELAELRGDLDACQAKDAKKRGDVALSFLIRGDGSIGDVKVSSSSVSSPAIEKCLIGVLAAASLSARPGAKAVSYTLSIAFAAGGSANAPSGGALVPQKDGPLDGALIQKAIRGQQPAIDRCYKAQLKKNPDLAGVVTIRFSVYADGKTYNAAVKETTLNDAAVESCVVKVFAGLTFPAEPTREKTRVFYPLRFATR